MLRVSDIWPNQWQRCRYETIKSLPRTDLFSFYFFFIVVVKYRHANETHEMYFYFGLLYYKYSNIFIIIFVARALFDIWESSKNWPSTTRSGPLRIPANYSTKKKKSKKEETLISSRYAVSLTALNAYVIHQFSIYAECKGDRARVHSTSIECLFHILDAGIPLTITIFFTNGVLLASIFITHWSVTIVRMYYKVLD